MRTVEEIKADIDRVNMSIKIFGPDSELRRFLAELDCELKAASAALGARGK